MHLQMRFFRNKIDIDIYMIAAACIILLSMALRLFFIAQNWPRTDSDEGTVGLMALHIAQLKDFPVYMYGQGGTLGSLEAFVGALLFPLFGPTAFALRFGLLLLFALFLISMYALTSLLYTRGLALLTLVLLSLGTPEILFREYSALAGHAETPLFGALLVLVAARLALSSPEHQSAERRSWRRMLGYGVWGALVGLAFWNDPLAGPFMLTSAVFLFVFCRHELRRPVLICIGLGLLLGLFPILIYNFTVPLKESSLSVFSFLVDTGHPVASDSLFERLGVSFLVTLPISTGATPLCPTTGQNVWPLTAQILPCTLVHGAWSLVLAGCWLTAGIMALRFLHSTWRPFFERTMALDLRKETILQGARLMLVGSALLTFLIFALSVQSITGPWSNHRYLIALGVATPALLWPLWRTLTMASWRPARAVVLKLFCGLVLACYIVTMGVGTWLTTTQIAAAQSYMRARGDLASTLIKMHVTHIYTDYWSCNLTAFLTLERVQCDVLDTQLQQGVNRYQPYVSVVEHDPHAAYVFQADSPQARALALRLKQGTSGTLYLSTYVDGYVIYQPVN